MRDEQETGWTGSDSRSAGLLYLSSWKLLCELTGSSGALSCRPYTAITNGRFVLTNPSLFNRSVMLPELVPSLAWFNKLQTDDALSAIAPH